MNLLCRNCGAQLQLEPQLRTATCPYCASPSVVEQPPSAERPAVEYVLGLAQPEAEVRARVAHWLRRRSLFAHSGVKRATVQELKGLYVPAYLYSAEAHTRFSAHIGENYTVTETYTTTDSQGRRVTRTRTRIETEWYPLRGERAEYLQDVLVTASRGLSNAELESLEPFELRQLQRYSPALLSGWMAEEPSLAPPEGSAQASVECRALVERRLQRFLPGDSSRGLDFETRLANEALSLVLLPVWVSALRYDPERPPMRVLVNGQTGEVVGKVPLSPVKIALAVLASLLLLLAVWLFVQQGGGR
ncbi:MAG TPA: hypothetical protein VFO83_08855 [Aggregicoccus sp.]|nr:hypothetical protein [Aggregicoccus sp.]